MSTLQVKSLYKYFGKVKAVQDVSFEVYPGEIFGLLGPNGAGKTTSIRIILDIYQADAGEVLLFGGKLDQEKKQRIGYLPEERGLYKDLNLEVTLVYLASLKGMDASLARKNMVDWLKRLDLYEHRQKKIQELSKGMQQKAQIIATLLHEPDLIIIDEPFAGLDPVNTRLVKEIIEEQSRAGKTVVMSTHQMYQVEALCSRIVLIDHGKTVLYGEVAQIKRDFSGNAVIVEGEGSFENIEGVLEARRENGSWHLALDTNTEPQQVLRLLAARQDIRVDRFATAEPSLDDIFVRVVKGSHEPRHA
jgi:ABC-2 type transport system ATP-binding protein